MLSNQNREILQTQYKQVKLGAMTQRMSRHNWNWNTIKLKLVNTFAYLPGPVHMNQHVSFQIHVDEAVSQKQR